jgi:hypothetical protein
MGTPHTCAPARFLDCLEREFLRSKAWRCRLVLPLYPLQLVHRAGTMTATHHL